MNDKPIDNCYWVIPGKFLAGEYPRDLDEASSIAKVAALTNAGITAFIDLTQEGELHPYSQWLNPGNHTHERFPIRDAHTPESPGVTSAILDAIDGHLAGGQPVYLHCFGGIGRTGTIVGCWLARHGHPGPEALARLSELWEECPKSKWTRSPETVPQCLYVISWKEGEGDQPA